MSCALSSWVGAGRVDTLIRCEWVFDVGEDAWQMFGRVLSSMALGQEAFEDINGYLTVGREGDVRMSERWPMEVTPEGLRVLQERVRHERGQGYTWLPSGGGFRVASDVLLPETVDAVKVANWRSDEERDCEFDLDIAPAIGRVDVPLGYRCWKIKPDVTAPEECAPVYLKFLIDGVVPSGMWMYVRSELELFRVRSFEGDIDVSGGRENLAWLRKAVDIVASQTGGRSSWSTEIARELGLSLDDDAP